MNTPKFKKLVIKPISEVQPVPFMEKIWVFLFTLFILFITKFNSFVNSFSDDNQQSIKYTPLPIIIEKVDEKYLCRYCCTKVDNPFITVSTCIHSESRPVHTKCFKTFHDFEFSCTLCDLEKSKDCICEAPIECDCNAEIPDSPVNEITEGLEVVGVKKEIFPCESETCEHDSVLEEDLTTEDVKEFLETQSE